MTHQRAMGFAQPLQPGVHFYPGVISPQLNEFALHGTWTGRAPSRRPRYPRGATIQAGFQAAHVYLVLTSAGNVPRQRARAARRPPDPAPSQAGADVHGGLVTVTGQRLYSLVSRPTAEQHSLTLQVPPGVSAYDFTFG